MEVDLLPKCVYCQKTTNLCSLLKCQKLDKSLTVDWKKFVCSECLEIKPYLNHENDYSTELYFVQPDLQTPIINHQTDSFCLIDNSISNSAFRFNLSRKRKSTNKTELSGIENKNESFKRFKKLKKVKKERKKQEKKEKEKEKEKEDQLVIKHLKEELEEMDHKIKKLENELYDSQSQLNKYQRKIHKMQNPNFSPKIDKLETIVVEKDKELMKLTNQSIKLTQEQDTILENHTTKTLELSTFKNLQTLDDLKELDNLGIKVQAGNDEQFSSYITKSLDQINEFFFKFPTSEREKLMHLSSKIKQISDKGTIKVTKIKKKYKKKMKEHFKNVLKYIENITNQN
ncbi:hypothetical protein M0812_14285 [Anaeramoeba flamelloides]|uniref:Uncharacterized protein n=1 Tax=Anaeramoeba flamelloides TaxID=1746091 RepID=A0AAV7ZHP2_9EUKA|nr:hypothetical protein M0812_14285 [Anaeramoeba flamelloides]